ncbi:hypothetical protein SAMN05421504_109261 [Amycolatopsis xylanica]|uniref:Uridine kinase n=1 Tax=Amycolatopsis xylanica TaxID=589385 RepID=A0A1H3QDD3_9PSEU|nr:uridine kinase [Amycolatopsis xylanica]SDZ11367.1 hypothetical protein SAMN05421504_109261 [Amycolatopsis xylanica]
MRYQPISYPLLADDLTRRVLAFPGRRVAVLIDGAAGTAELADALVDPLRLNGRAPLRVSSSGFLRPASLRFEHGRTDPESRYRDWTDFGALRREVLDPLRPGGSGEVLPALWDTERDRATRLPRVPLPPDGVVLLDGEMLLGSGLAADLTVHLWLSPGALRRHLPASDHWALPAFARYESEVDPASLADLVVRADDPNHPALRLQDP